LDATAIPAALVRAVAVGALLALTGTLLARRTRIAPRDAAAPLERASAASGAVALVVWFLLVAQSLIGGDLAETAAGLPLVLQTVFGHIFVLQFALLALAAVAQAVRLRVLALLAASLAMLAQAGHLHAAAMYGLRPSVLLVSEALHLLGGAMWIGALPALLTVLLRAEPGQARAAARRFSAIGLAGLLLLALSAAYQSVVLLGGVAGGLGTDYGRIAIAKMVLLAALIGFALRHRFILLPRLYGTDPVRAQAALARSVAMQAGIGALAILLAALLSTASPGMHM
jgi:putative copper export protein